MSEKVQRGKIVSAQIRLLDRHGKAMAPSALKFMTIVPSPMTQHVKLYPKENTTPGELLYNVKGERDMLILKEVCVYMCVHGC